MKKLIIISMLLLSSNIFAAEGIVIKDHICGRNAIIEILNGSYDGYYVGAIYYSGYEYKIGEWMRAIFSSPGTRYFVSNGGIQSQYFISVPTITIDQAKQQICNTL